MMTRLQRQVLVVDENPLTRFGILSVANLHPELHVCEEAADARTARALFHTQAPGVVILDVALPRGDGIELIREFSQVRKECCFVVVSSLRDATTVQRAFQAGAAAYVSKSDEAAELFCALEAVISGQTYVGKKVNEVFRPDMRGKSLHRWEKLLAILSNRESHIFRRIGHGQGTSEIARELGISVKTVETHQKRIQEKLHVVGSRQLQDTAREWLEAMSS